MKEIYFIVDGRVQPKQRPRVVRRKVKVGNEYITKTMTFTPRIGNRRPRCCLIVYEPHRVRVCIKTMKGDRHE